MEGTNTQWTKNKSKQIQNTGSSAKLRESNVEDFNIESWFNDFLNLLSVEQTFAVLLQTETPTETKTLGHRENETGSKWTFLTDVLMTESPEAA